MPSRFGALRWQLTLAAIALATTAAFFLLLGRLASPEARPALARARRAALLLVAGFTILLWVMPAALYVAGIVSASAADPTYVFGHVAARARYSGRWVLFAAVSAYAILRYQLLGIDLRIKWTIRRGTLVAAFAATFVVAAEVAQSWLSDSFGYAAGGVVAAALLVALRPLDRLSTRVADAAMPSVHPTPEYLQFRKYEIYRQAVRDATSDGALTGKERAVLNGLRRTLGIADADAAAMERDLAMRAGDATERPY